MSSASDPVRALSPDKLALLRKIQDNQNARANAGGLQPQPRAGNSHFPVSWTQQQMWLLQQFAPEASFLNVSSSGILDTAIHAPALEGAMNEMMKRHETLRTSFGIAGGEPVQFVAAACKPQMAFLDLQRIPEAEREPQARMLLAEDAARPFALNTAPLIRATLTRLSPRRHIFCVTAHHIIFDGWSLGVFWRELEAIYACLLARAPMPFPPLTIQYADYVIWQRERLEGASLDEGLAYWKRRLAGAPTLELPTDFARPPAQTFRVRAMEIALPGDLTSRLKELGNSERATLFMTLLAGFAILLHRYTSQDDIVIGSPTANRERPETHGIIGCFVNTLVLRIDLAGNPTIRELLARVRDIVLAAFDQAEVPFEKIVSELRPERDLSRNPLVQVIFQLFTLSGSSHGERAAAMRSQWNGASGMFDLAFHLWEGNDETRGQIEFCPDLFRPESIARMAEHWEVVLESMAANAEQRLSDVSLLGASELHRVVEEWNDTAADWDGADNLVALFEQQVELSPDAESVKDSRASLSYRELNGRANGIARRLQEHGVGSESIVGVCLERSVESVAAMLGVLKTGAAYLPLDPGYPQQRLAWMVEDSGARVVLGEQRFEHVTCIDANEIPPQDENVHTQIRPENAAYVIYTSGSTGQPKGVVGLHGATVNRLRWMWREFPYREESVSCQKTASSFVDSVWETFGGLLAGIRTVILSEDESRDAERMLERAHAEGVTRIVVVPSLLRVLLELKPPPKLTEWFVSGEALETSSWERFQERAPGARLINLYGSSEVAGDATWYEMRAGEGVSIGRAMTNVRTYVLDDQLNPLPIGVTGELYVSGSGLARGYLNRPDLTAERFVPDPYSDKPGARMYRTGDLARWRSDGNLEYVGRRDHQVKIRGHRIELGEIEAELSRHERVKEAVVLARADRLVAYLVGADAGAQQDELTAELIAAMRTRLPDYMIPSSILILEAMPLSPNGKIDRRALLALEAPAGEAQAWAPPSTPTEEMLARIWSEVLKVEKISVYDNFFELGGHSLLATQLISRIRDAFGMPMPIRAVFEAPTVSSLAQLIDDAKAPTELRTEREELPIVPAPRSQYLVTSS